MKETNTIPTTTPIGGLVAMVLIGSVVVALGVSASQLVVTDVAPNVVAAGDLVFVSGTGFGPEPWEHRVFAWDGATTQGVSLMADAVAPGQLVARLGLQPRPVEGELVVARGLAYSLPSPQIVPLGPRILWVHNATWFESQAVVTSPGTFAVLGDLSGSVESYVADGELRADVEPVASTGGGASTFRLTVGNLPNDGGGPPPDATLPGRPVKVLQGDLDLSYDPDSEGLSTLDAKAVASDLAEVFNQNFEALGLQAVAEEHELVITSLDAPITAGFVSVVWCEGNC